MYLLKILKNLGVLRFFAPPPLSMDARCVWPLRLEPSRAHVIDHPMPVLRQAVTLIAAKHEEIYLDMWVYGKVFGTTQWIIGINKVAYRLFTFSPARCPPYILTV